MVDDSVDFVELWVGAAVDQDCSGNDASVGWCAVDCAMSGRENPVLRDDTATTEESQGGERAERDLVWELAIDRRCCSIEEERASIRNQFCVK
jgi:hypothetical protein